MACFWGLTSLAVQGPDDARLYRRRFVFELLMALADSAVAEPAAKAEALATLCRAARIPAAARDLAASAGVVYHRNFGAQKKNRNQSLALAMPFPLPASPRRRATSRRPQVRLVITGYLGLKRQDEKIRWRLATLCRAALILAAARDLAVSADAPCCCRVLWAGKTV